ncbi:MAG: hypothetical protein K0B15_13945 [Lentimicrobium sp.]|nr:hypothetical protein [Lentimicrobium sp.]
MITEQEFREMPAKEQVSVVLENGMELLDRIYVYYVVKLYRVDHLYIEIWYQQLSNQIDKVKLVNLEDVLHLYESQINISDLYR